MLLICASARMASTMVPLLFYFSLYLRMVLVTLVIPWFYWIIAVDNICYSNRWTGRKEFFFFFFFLLSLFSFLFSFFSFLLVCMCAFFSLPILMKKIICIVNCVFVRKREGEKMPPPSRRKLTMGKWKMKILV